MQKSKLGINQVPGKDAILEEVSSYAESGKI